MGNKRKVCIRAKRLICPKLIPASGWDVSPASIKFAGTHLFTRMERGGLRVMCLAPKYNTVFPARARAQTARCGDERTNKH